MTQEEKQLVLLDLSARLSCGVICKTPKGDGHLCSINQTIFGTEYGININPIKRDYFGDSEVEEQIVKPYLRSMSSMMEEEFNEFNEMFTLPICSVFNTVHNKYRYYDRVFADFGHYEEINLSELDDMLIWLRRHHFDYRSLIPKGLALEAPEGMYKTE